MEEEFFQFIACCRNVFSLLCSGSMTFPQLTFRRHCLDWTRTGEISRSLRFSEMTLEKNFFSSLRSVGMTFPQLTFRRHFLDWTRTGEISQSLRFCEMTLEQSLLYISVETSPTSNPHCPSSGARSTCVTATAAHSPNSIHRPNIRINFRNAYGSFRN